MSQFDDTIVDVLADRIRALIASREAGHCAQVPDVPRKLADRLCKQLHGHLHDAHVYVVVDKPKRDHHAAPAKIVELRNDVEANGTKLVVVLPAGKHLPVEDSFGATTFEIVDTSDVYDEVRRQAFAQLEEVAPHVAARAAAIVDEVVGHAEFGVGPQRAAQFAVAALSTPNTAGVAQAMHALGLVPDETLLAEEEGAIAPRLGRNLQVMNRLSAPDAPADRVRDLVLGDDQDAERLRKDLVEVVEGDVQDRWGIAARMAELGAAKGKPLGRLLDEENAAPKLNRFEILALDGDFVDASDPPRVDRRQPRVKVKLACEPPAKTVLGLSHLRLSVLHRPERSTELIDAGIQKTKRVASMGAGTQSTWGIKLDTETLEPGLYVIQVEAIDDNNYPVEIARSEPFAVEAVYEPPQIERDVPSVAMAALLARQASGEAPGHGRVVYARRDESKTKAVAELFLVRFPNASGTYRLLVPKPLTQIETWSIATPREPTNYTLDRETLQPIDQEPLVGLPEEFLDAREALMTAVPRSQMTTEDDIPLCLATTDLMAMRSAVDQYLESWRDRLDRGDRPARELLLSLDQVRIDGIPDCVLVGPAHPLRIAWLLRYQELLDTALPEDVSDGDIDQAVALAESLTPANVPHVVVRRHEELRYLDAVSLGWGVWAKPSSPVAGPAAAELRWRLTGSRKPLGGISALDVVQRLKRYLAAHPYVRTLQMNLVQPGRGDLILEALLALQSDPAYSDVRYELRLFAAELTRSSLGEALDAFMADPDAVPNKRKDSADAFLASNDDPLAPKLTYSKHSISELADDPERFPAHVSVFIDWFDLDAVPVPPVEGRRSFYADGVLIDPIVVFHPGDEGLDPQWDEYVAPGPPYEPFAHAYAAAELATATLLGATVDGNVPAIRLRLDRVRRSILDTVHRTSDWVMTIDPVFTDEFLDSRHGADETPRYLIDSAEGQAVGSTRNIVVSTRSRLELGELLRPVLEQYDLPIAEDRVGAVLDAMHALNPGLGLRLLNAPTQAIEAMTLGMAAIELEAEGTLRRCLAIPLDLHQEVFREELAVGHAGIEVLSRTDLALVRPRPKERILDIHLVEVKARRDLPATLPTTFVEGITSQLDNSEAVLRSSLFGIDERVEGSRLVAWMRTRRLTRILSHYAERARRYGNLSNDDAAGLREFIASLEEPFEVRFSRHGLVFDLGPQSREEELVSGGARIRRIPRERVLLLLNKAPTRLGTAAPLPTVPSLLDEVGDQRGTSVPAVRSADEEALRAEPVAHPAEQQKQPVPTDEPGPVADEGPSPEEVHLIGQAEKSAQFGIIGTLRSNGRPVAFDVDRTNVVSVFGVQGSGKSYTVGNLIEAAVVREPALNRLKSPLGVVVFHFSTNQTYRPEFASMVEPNNDPRQLDQLTAFGAGPHAIPDVQLLVPSDLVEERRAEFQNRLETHPLVLSPKELDLNDWKLHMGVEGGEQMYVKAMATILRAQRKSLSIEGLRSAVTESSLSRAQQENALTRLGFVENFVADDGGVAHLVKPGRVLIVDVRDPLMEKEEALALFMVLLRACSLARDDNDESFNKLIVFDEAHKYMDSARLTGAIVEAIREMRHQGNTIVIASQDPPSVPREVIELSTITMVHRFMSPEWLNHIKKASAAFASGIAPPQLARLESGEAFVYSSGGDPLFANPQRVTMRPRMTRHGGTTKSAVDRQD